MNRMISMGSTNFTYDANGNNTNATGQWNSDYTWDLKIIFLQVLLTALVCEYDALENRRRKNDTFYIYLTFWVEVMYLWKQMLETQYVLYSWIGFDCAFGCQPVKPLLLPL
ncbi:MAG: hypothetical protein IPP79_08055 [Chitinophagaceae bacterium]|nr:hypothetical protein [Chitinophagaceae bacterium]